MIVSTAPFIAGHRVVETKGQTFGLVVRSRGFSGNLIAGLRSLAGGEIHEYTQLLEDTRRQALDRLVKNATLMGANAVISMRFDSSELAGTMSEIVAYGTAVVVEPDASAPPGDRVARCGEHLRPRRPGRRRRPAHARSGWAIIAGVPDVGAFIGLQLVRDSARSSWSSSPSSGSRYRSDTAERSNAAPGPGGGEPPGRVEPRFRPTSEVFIDPTSDHRMRVLVDPATGERRYVAEG